MMTKTKNLLAVVLLGALLTGLGDTGAALLAALFLVPTMLVFGLDMTSGPTLIFASPLPESALYLNVPFLDAVSNV